ATLSARAAGRRIPRERGNRDAGRAKLRVGVRLSHPGSGVTGLASARIERRVRARKTLLGTMPIQMNVDGQRVKTLRLQQSWSQELLAEKAGVSLRTIQRIEAGGVASLPGRLSRFEGPAEPRGVGRGWRRDCAQPAHDPPI